MPLSGAFVGWSLIPGIGHTVLAREFDQTVCTRELPIAGGRLNHDGGR